MWYCYQVICRVQDPSLGQEQASILSAAMQLMHSCPMPYYSTTKLVSTNPYPTLQYALCCYTKKRQVSRQMPNGALQGQLDHVSVYKAGSHVCLEGLWTGRQHNRITLRPIDACADCSSACTSKLARNSGPKLSPLPCIFYRSLIHSHLPDMKCPICWFDTHATNMMTCFSSLGQPDSYLEVLSHDKQDVLGCLESVGISNA